MNNAECRTGLNSTQTRLKQKWDHPTDPDLRDGDGKYDESFYRNQEAPFEPRETFEVETRETDLPATSRAVPTAQSIRILNPLETADWDERVRHFPGATSFHSAAWARVLHSTYGFEPVYLTRGDANNFESVLPMMEVNSWLTGRRGVALPFTDECEPLVPNEAAFPPLFAAAQAQGDIRGWKYLECRGGRPKLDHTPASTTFYDHRLQLQPDESALFASFDGAVRSNLRKAEQSNLTIEFSQSMEALQVFHGLFLLTRQRHGTPPQPFRFFANIQRHILAKNQGWVVLAWQGKVPVAAAIFLHFGESVIYKFSASNKDLQHLRANNLVIWHAIRHYARNGFTSLHFGRTSLDNDGLRRFKLSWGTQERKNEYVRCELKTRRFVVTADHASGWSTHILQKMPPFISRLIGVLLYRHMA